MRREVMQRVLCVPEGTLKNSRRGGTNMRAPISWFGSSHKRRVWMTRSRLGHPKACWGRSDGTDASLHAAKKPV